MRYYTKYYSNYSITSFDFTWYLSYTREDIDYRNYIN